LSWHSLVELSTRPAFYGSMLSEARAAALVAGLQVGKTSVGLSGAPCGRATWSFWKNPERLVILDASVMS
jgi:hypothetical protein